MTPPLPRIALAALTLISPLAATEFVLPTFERQQLEPYYWSEGAAFGDLDRDGKVDAIYGPYWFKGPAFTERHELYPPAQTFVATGPEGTSKTLPGYEGGLGSKNAYSRDNFFAFVHDVNGDGWNDVLVYAFPGTAAHLYLNPAGRPGHWQQHTVFEQVGNESPAFIDITGDGRPEIVCVSDGNFGYASADWSNPTAPWKFTPITREGKWPRFSHGLGVGDLNGDGRLDILFAEGWFEQPASREGAPLWRRHAAPFARAGAQLHVYDVNGDGRMDVISALAAHGFGLAWHEQLAEKTASGSPRFKMHLIMNEQPHENRYGVTFSELHAVELVDIDGDGLKDIVTGKCFWSHGPEGSPDGDQPAVLYWFRLARGSDGSVDWVPHLIDADSGVGRQIAVGDIDGDRRPDLMIGNKKGAIVFRQRATPVSEAAWRRAQPAPVVVEGRVTARDRVLQPGSAPQAGMSAARLEQIKADYRREVDEQKYPFVGYLIARNGRIVAHEAIGSAHHGNGAPLRTDSIFPLASVTKAFTATAFMILWDEGRVAFEEPVRAYLPEFSRMTLAEGGPATAPLKMLHLLTHSAGFAGHFPTHAMPAEEWEARKDWTLATFVERVARQPLRFNPGTAEQYSSLNTDIVARVVEVVSGTEFSAFLHERLFAPLGMKDTSHFPPPDLHDRIARSHRFEDGRWVPAAEPLEFDRSFPHGGYGLYSTTGDLAVFVQMLLNGGVYNGRRILSPRAVDRMLQMLSPVPHQTTDGWQLVRGASWEVGATLRGIKPRELPAAIPTRSRRPDEPQRFFGRTGQGGMFVFADRDSGVVGIFATKASGRADSTPAKDIILRALSATVEAKP